MPIETPDTQTRLPMSRGPFYHGTRTDLRLGDLIEPQTPPVADDSDEAAPYVYLSPDPDAAIWDAELAAGEDPGRVYVVEPLGPIEDARLSTDWTPPGHPAMAWRSRDPLRVAGEVTEWPFYHGTRVDLKVGDLVKPGHVANFGSSPRTANHVYMARTLDAAKWGAELAAGEKRGRIYIVEPTGPIEDDPNLTDKKFKGNPTKSFRSLQPLRVVGEVREWQGHSAEVIRSMQEGLARLRQMGDDVIDD